MTKSCRLLLAGLGLAVFGHLGQVSAQVFDEDALPVVQITLSAADLTTLFAPGNEESDVEYLATFRWSSPSLSAEIDSVGFRLRGNTSRNSQKKSFKVSFNTFRSGGKWEGLEKLNLNGEHNDPSIMRSKVAWDLFREMGVPASRANHVQVYINGAYYGLYINIEHVDEEFLQRYFGDDTGNLYKALWPADLTVVGSGDGSAYRPDSGNRRPYDLTQGASDEQGYDDLAQLIGLINNTSGSGFKGAIESAMDVSGLLKAQAVTALTGSWDSYWFLKNNFYLYNNPATGKWHYVPFDFDNTFGIYWEGIWPDLNWATRDVYEWGHPSEERPLMTRIMAVPEFRERYTYYLRELLEDHFIPSKLGAEISRLKTLTEAAAEADTFRTKDYGYTIADYHDSFTSPLSGHVTEGLLPYISQRYSSALGQLDAGQIAPLISSVRVLPERPRWHDSLRVSAQIVTGSLALAQVEYWPDVPQRQSVIMAQRSGEIYGGVVPPLGMSGTVDLRVRAADGQGNERTSSLLRIRVDDSKPPVYINELMASNAATMQDEFGEYDDWVELYNASESAVSVGGWTLTDRLDQPDRYTLPDISIPGRGHLLIWPDGQPEQGPLHAGFRLAAAGEQLALLEADGREVDYVSFGVQTPDLSLSRGADGGPFFNITHPTPGAPNPLVQAVDDLPIPMGGLAIYPNPFTSELHVEGGPFEVFDVLGRRVFSSADGEGSWSPVGVSPGIYFVRLAEPGARFVPVVKVQ
ncbi:MAG: spore coat protein H [Rhodothermales bacterium]|jgi:spore coat protein H